MSAHTTARGGRSEIGVLIAVIALLAGCGSNNLPPSAGQGGSGGGREGDAGSGGGSGGSEGAGTGGSGGSPGGSGGQVGGSGGQSGGSGGQSGGPCSVPRDKEVQALRSALHPEYHGVVTYADRSKPTADLTIRLTDQGKSSCRELSANGGIIGFEIGVEMGFTYSTSDGAFNETFATTISTKGALTGGAFLDFDYRVTALKGTFDPGPTHLPEVSLTGNFSGTTTSGIVWLWPAMDCGCAGKPGCICSNNGSSSIGAQWK
ncbi:MAG: hypothetical protein QOI66_4266 [Myxococcales bacterium]|jgi:hypothetical protein|nr:hypothetical protein [Myxococcales bacterium]